MLSKRLSETILLLSLLLPISLSYKVFKLNHYIYFDPVTDSKCDESNYWTPFYQSTTCYRWVNLVKDDDSSSSTLKIMLDHNIANSTFLDYKTTLSKYTALWKRYDGKIDIIDEDTIYDLMLYDKKPTTAASATPPFRLGHYFMNTRYIIDGKLIDQKGYWTKTSTGSKIYGIDNYGNNVIYAKNMNLGIRPVININKKILVKNADNIDITNILEKFTVYKYKYENKYYSNLIYKNLEGFTLTKDKLVFISANNNNREKSVMYSYYTKDFKTPYKVTYSDIGHGNGMTYNSKTNKVLVAGPDEYKKLYEFNGSTLKKEKEYSISVYPKFNGIGYDYNDDLYIGFTGKRLFITDTIEMKKIYEWDLSFFETSQDLEYYNGYIFYITTEAGPGTKYQGYSFYNKGDNFISVYNAKLDSSGKPTNNFGRLVCRLYMTGKGELEDISFRDGNIYLGFATRKIDDTYSYTFYKMSYKNFLNEIRIIAKKQGNVIFD